MPHGPATDDLAEVARALTAFIDDRAARSPAAADIWAEIRRASTGGKLLRPRLVLAAHDALDGRDRAAARRAGAAMELLHTAFLIHDDVIDRDWTRRGEPNVAAAFRANAAADGRSPAIAEHYGTSAAIIAGDLAIAGAVDLAWTASQDLAVGRALAGIVSEAVSATAAGELMDVELAATPRGRVEAVLSMYEAKTSVYSFCAPLQAGAVIAGADDATIRSLRGAGMALGVAFQVADDLLGTFGDEAVTGKSAASDAREGKQTVLTALMAEAAPGAADRFRAAAGTDDEAFAQAYRDAIEGSGARDAATELVRERTEAARRHLDAAPAALRAALDAVLDDLHERVA